MVYLPEIPKDSYKVDIARICPDPALPTALGVRHQDGRVILFINSYRVDLNTVHAHRIGMDLGSSVIAPDEMRTLTINGERVDLPDPLALQLSAALLRKADEADDWQLQRKRKSS
jgi:hypothetical protein